MKDPMKATKPAAKKVPAKKVAAKKVVAKEVPLQRIHRPQSEQLHDMTVEIRDWIANAHSRINHLTSENERLKEEIIKLKRANRVMESRVMGSSYE